MENNSVNQTESIFELLQEQINVLLSMISRPAVQRQVLAVILIFILAWLVTEGFRRWRQRGRSEEQLEEMEHDSPQDGWRVVVQHLITPILAGVFLNITIIFFAQQGYPYGLLISLVNLIWLWLIYRVLLIFFYRRSGEAFRPYKNRILTPIFLVLVANSISRNIPRSFNLRDTTINLGTLSFTLGNLATALIVFYIFVVAAWVIRELLIKVLPARLNAEPGVVESAATLVRYMIIAMGIIISLGVLGLDFTSLAIIAGGLSVGIGIGLQDIVANFVSGLVLLFEQSLRPGDVVELDGRISKVEKISLRATTVRTRTNEELIIPNSNFTTHLVKNLTKSDRIVQLVVPIGVSYKSDPEFIRQLTVETSLKHPLVLAAPPPKLNFMGYGASSLDFNLLASINQPEWSNKIRSDLYYMLWKSFSENNVEIPFPQQDLNMGDGWEKFAADLRGT